MLFTSPIFVFLFLPIVVLLYFVSGTRLRNTLLLIASLVFYSWGEGAYVVLILFSILFNYLLGLLIAHHRKRSLGVPIVALAVLVNIGLLAIFKYADFSIYSVNPVLRLIGVQPISAPRLHLPIGISFYTFHALSYIIDVYRGTVTVQRNLGTAALYITLFPQLVAGPIVRYRDIASQFQMRTVTWDGFGTGVQRFMVGFAKKALIADQLAIPADQIFGLARDQLSSPVAWLGVACYTLQIYFDFSGYSDMAIGLAQMFGFQFLENFNFPYISQSITEFWRRWHISLSNWFRDYLYIPLGGSRHSPTRTYFNLVVVFFLVGLWHGASWNFVIWGLYYGVFLVLERLGLGNWLARLLKPLRHLYTMLIVMVGWVFFRSETLPQAWSITKALGGLSGTPSPAYALDTYLSPWLILVILIAAATALPLVTYWEVLRDRILLSLSPKLASIASASFSLTVIIALLVIFVAALVVMAGNTYRPFIYFRF